MSSNAAGKFKQLDIDFEKLLLDAQIDVSETELTAAKKTQRKR